MTNLLKLILLISSIPCLIICNRTIEVIYDPYLDQEPPGSIPVVFAPGIISVEGRNERCLAISPNGDEIFFRIERFPYSKIMRMERVNDIWTLPDTAIFSKDCWATEPSFLPDGKYLYFSSSKGKSDIWNYHIWRVKKDMTGWSGPESILDIEGSNVWEFHPSVTSNSILYFTWWQSNSGDIYSAEPDADGYSEIIKLDKPINTGYQDAAPYIDPEESYLIIKSDRPGGYGGIDAYISYKRSDNTWTNPKNLGPKINTQNDDDNGDISPDGKYLFFTRNDNIYWVNASFIDSLRYTNFDPYVKNSIPDTTLSVNENFSFQIPENTFFDDDQDTLIYDAIERGKGELPDWLHFDRLTRTLSGTPFETGIIDIEITVTDEDSANVNDIFRITIQDNTTIN